MLEAVKLALPVKGAARDPEIQDLINSALAELRAAGVDAAEDSDDPRVLQAVKLYCKGNFGSGLENAPRFIEGFEKLRIAMALDHGEPEATP